jgi:hypothetical protein
MISRPLLPGLWNLAGLLAVFLCGAINGSAALWTFASPKVPCSQTLEVIHANGKWVGVGIGGKIITSPDAITWTHLPQITGETLRDVIHTGTRFVACGDKGILLSSVDGVDWEYRFSGTRLDLHNVEYGAGVYVVTGKKFGTGDPPVIFTSTDLITWTEIRMEGLYVPDTYGPHPEAMSFSNGKFLYPLPGEQNLVSSDGYAWTRETTGARGDLPMRSLYHAGRYYCLDAYGKLTWSTNGTQWTSIIFFPRRFDRMTDLLVDGNRIVITSTDGFYTSTNQGSTWTNRGISSEYFNEGCGSVAKAGDIYVVMSYDGSALRSEGFVWATYTGRLTSTYMDVVHGDGKFVAVGRWDAYNISAAISYSHDGVNWEHRSKSGYELYGVCHGNGTWVAVGNGFSKAGVLYSSDLTNWTQGAASTTQELRGVTFANGIFVAVGGVYDTSLILTSPDGMAWTQRSSDARGPLNAITFAEGRFVAVGGWNSDNKGEIMTSPDGITWTRSSFPASIKLGSVVYGNSHFLASGTANYLLKSDDGLNWSTVNLVQHGNIAGWVDIAFDGERFVSLPGTPRGPADSSDGVHWTPQIYGTGGLTAIASGGGKSVAVGTQGHILMRPVEALPAGPTGVSANSATVSWDTYFKHKGFLLHRRLVGNSIWQDADTPLAPTQNSHLIPDLTPETEYEFAVQAATAQGLTELVIVRETTFDDLDMWRVTHFGSTSTTGAGAPDADTDDDGLPQIVEYAIGSNPHVYDPEKLIHAVTYSDLDFPEFGVEPHMAVELRFFLDTRRTRVNVFLDSTTDLQTWTPFASSIAGARMSVLGSETSRAYLYDGYTSPSSNPVRQIESARHFPTRSGPQHGFVRLRVEERAN